MIPLRQVLYHSCPLQNFRCLYLVYNVPQIIFVRSTFTQGYLCVYCLFVTKIEYYCLTDYNHDNEFSVSYDFARISIPCDARLPTRIHNVGYIGWWVLFLCLLSVILAGLYTSDIVWLCKLLRLCVTHYNSIPIIILLCTLTSLSYGGQSKGSYFISE